jgi:hypothetical protein
LTCPTFSPGRDLQAFIRLKTSDKRLGSEVINQNSVVATAALGGGPVLRIAELVTQRELPRTDFYHDILRPMGVRDQTLLHVATGHPVYLVIEKIP